MFKTVATLRIITLLTAIGLSGHAYSTDIPFTMTGSSPYCGGSNAQINYDGSAFTFVAGNTFTAQLSNASGSFASPTVIGTLSGTATFGSIPITFPAGASGTNYRVRIVSSNPAVTSSDNGSSLTITPATSPSVVINASPTYVLCNSHTATINATPTGGGGAPSYSWTRNGVPVGTNSSSYSATDFNNGDAIIVTMTSNASCPLPSAVQSNTITIIQNNIVAPSVTISGPPVVCQGQNAVFTATPVNGGTSPSYQWKKNGIIVGTNSATYNDTGLINGDDIVVAMTSNRECVSVVTVNSNTIDVAVTSQVTPTISIAADPVGSVGTGSAVYIAATITNGGASPAFEWKRNGVVVGGNTNVYVANATANDEYVATLTSSASCATPATASSNTVTLSVDPNKTKAGHAWEPRAGQISGSLIVRSNASGFTINGKAYIGMGFNMVGASPNYRKDLWEYDPVNDTWSQKVDLGMPGTPGAQPRANAVGFAIGSKGYIGGGVNASGALSDFYEYNPANNTWLVRVPIPGQPREQAFGFAIGTKGYVGGGYSSANGDYQDFHEFDPAANTWAPKANFGGGKRLGAASFSIDTKGFVAAGYSSSSNTWFKDFWTYDPLANAWTALPSMPGNPRTKATGFSLAGNGYVGLGNTSTGYDGQLFQYTVATNSWSAKPNFPGPSSQNWATALTLGNRAYVYKDGAWIEYNLFTTSPFASKICTSETVQIGFDASGFTFLTNNVFTAQISTLQNFSVSTILGTVASTASSGTINAPIPASSNGTYYLRITSSNPVITTLLETVTITMLPATHTINTPTGTTVCKDIAVTFNSNLTGAGFQWYKNGGPVGNDATSYTDATLANSDVIYAEKLYATGCTQPVAVTSNSIVMTIREPAKPIVTVTQPNILNSTAAVTYQWYKDNAQITNAKSQTYAMTSSGSYKVRISDSGGCFAFSDDLVNAFTGLGEDVFSGLVSTYPNPVANEMTLEVSDDLVAKGCAYSVLNELGQSVIGSQTASKMNKISFAGRSPGLYMVRLSVDGSTVIRRIVKVE